MTTGTAYSREIHYIARDRFSLYYNIIYYKIFSQKKILTRSYATPHTLYTIYIYNMYMHARALIPIYGYSTKETKDIIFKTNSTHDTLCCYTKYIQYLYIYIYTLRYICMGIYEFLVYTITHTYWLYR